MADNAPVPSRWESHGESDNPAPTRENTRSLIGRLIRTIVLSLRPIEVAEVALIAAGLTWRVLTTFARMTPWPAIFPAALVGGVIARWLYLRMTTTSAEAETERS
jgi:hypothetical protein